MWMADSNDAGVNEQVVVDGLQSWVGKCDVSLQRGDESCARFKQTLEAAVMPFPGPLPGKRQ